MPEEFLLLSASLFVELSGSTGALTTFRVVSIFLNVFLVLSRVVYFGTGLKPNKHSVPTED